MYSIPNILSLSRIPLALLFWLGPIETRIYWIVAAMLTDYLDGLIARRQGKVSRLGTLLDPIGDKFFVIVSSLVLIQDNVLMPWQFGAMLCRDLFFSLFAIYIYFKGLTGRFRIQTVFWSKLTTTLQFSILCLLTLGIGVPSFVFCLVIVTALFALSEMAKTVRRNRPPKKARVRTSSKL